MFPTDRSSSAFCRLRSSGSLGRPWTVCVISKLARAPTRPPADRTHIHPRVGRHDLGGHRCVYGLVCPTTSDDRSAPGPAECIVVGWLTSPPPSLTASAGVSPWPSRFRLPCADRKCLRDWDFRCSASPTVRRSSTTSLRTRQLPNALR